MLAVFVELPIFKNVQVTGISLNLTSLSVPLGTAPITFVATVIPNNAVNKYVIWHSTNTNVATVSNTGKVNFVGPGNATITATTENGNYTATCNVTVTATNGIEEIERHNIFIFPNPAKDNIFIQSQLPIGRVEISDIAGRSVISTNSNTVNISHLPQGIYLVKILFTDDSQSITKKIIKE
jgi:hypothetical protein